MLVISNWRDIMNKRTVNNILMIVLVIAAVSGITIHFVDVTLLKILHVITGLLLCVFAGIHISQMKR